MRQRSKPSDNTGVPRERLASPAQLPAAGYVRLRQIIGDPKAVPPIPPIIPVSKSTWWLGVATGRFPKPTKSLGVRITAWRVEDIRALIEKSEK